MQHSLRGKITFDEEGFTFRKLHVAWTVQPGEETIDYPPIAQLLLLLNEAQRRWNTVKEQKLTWLTQNNVAEGLLVASSQQDIAKIGLSAVITQGMQMNLNRIRLAVLEGEKDDEFEKDTFPRRLYRQITVNPDIMHFLTVLAAEEISYAFSAIELFHDLFPSYVSKEIEMKDEHIEKATWLTKNPLNPLPKLHFDRKTGTLVQ